MAGVVPPAASRSELQDVVLVSGQTIQVQGDAEVKWFNETRDTYVRDTRFTDGTDLRDLDRLLVLELMVYRWTVHLASGVDYDGHMIDEDGLRKNIQTNSAEITRVKQSMGLNKATRDAEANKGNIADYLANLKLRARAFGIHRNEQVTKVLALFNELSSIVGTFDRTDEEERAKYGFESEGEILDWIRNTAIPEYLELDTHFREGQALWVRDL